MAEEERRVYPKERGGGWVRPERSHLTIPPPFKHELKQNPTGTKRPIRRRSSLSGDVHLIPAQDLLHRGIEAHVAGKSEEAEGACN